MFASDKVSEISKLKHDGLWRLSVNNNNNNLVETRVTHNYANVEKEHTKIHRQSDGGTGTMAKAKAKQATAATTSTTALVVGSVTPTCVANNVVDKGGGGTNGDVGIATADAEAAALDDTDKHALSVLPPLNCDLDFGLAAAATASALSPSDGDAAAGGISSNRTSMNNSTENLSYASDNYYADDLILLDDDDVEAEEISLNSDDCVYAYRGDGADFDLAVLDASTGRGGRSLDFGIAGGKVGSIGGSDMISADDEFLEMDFEPDPPSELEFASGQANDDNVDHANLLLMQRDYNHLSGRRSMANMSLQTTPTQRQLFSSPIDDLPPQEALQQQNQRLSKTFARISLNLDQIKDGSSADIVSSGVENDDDPILDDPLSVTAAQKAQAHSLPNTLYGNFGRSSSEPAAEQSPSKVTGAKPKRLSTLSTSSSVSSKNSSKSRSSLRSAFAPTYGGNSASFDERCYSCTDFRSSGPTNVQQQNLDVAPMLIASGSGTIGATSAAIATSASAAAHFDLSTNEETCLDCLEKEFLANTIGKALDLSNCSKCRKRGSSLSLYARVEQTRRRSGSPSYFEEFTGGIFVAPAARKSIGDGWNALHCNGGLGGAVGVGVDGGPSNVCSSTGLFNQRFISCDNNFSGMQLLKQSFLTEPEQLVVRISIAHLSEDQLVQALDKLHVSYNLALLHGYFKISSKREHGNLKELVLYASKQQCNHRKLKKLIDLLSEQQLSVHFKKDKATNAPLVPVSVADVLATWARHRDLSVLRQLDKRFHQTNVMGRIGHIVRQAQQQQQQQVHEQPASSASSSSNVTRRALPEFIMIPQYYACGELTLSRKC